jgi:ketosteroid isomerase-like protein
MVDNFNSVKEREEELRLAMLAGNVDALSDLIDDDLTFTDPGGNVLTKADDLAAHRTGALKVERLDIFDSKLHSVGSMVLVTTKAKLEGRFQETTFSGVFAYTRLWFLSNGRWRIRVGHCSTIGPF